MSNIQNLANYLKKIKFSVIFRPKIIELEELEYKNVIYAVENYFLYPMI
jgi:hypothetical protein